MFEQSYKRNIEKAYNCLLIYITPYSNIRFAVLYLQRKTRTTNIREILLFSQ